MAKKTSKKRNKGPEEITVPPRVYNRKCRIEEEKLKEYLQENPHFLEQILRYKPGRVLWIGREFAPFKNKRADFTGFDSEGYLITVEVKVNQIHRGVVGQVKGITAEYRKLKEAGDINRRVREYILFNLRNAKWRYFMGPVSEWWGGKEELSLAKRAEITPRRIKFRFAKEYERFFRRHLKTIKGIKVFIIAPGIDQRIKEGLGELKKRIPKVQIKYITMDRKEKALTRLSYDCYEVL